MAAPELPPDFFTTASIFTLAGATSGVYVICGALQRAFNFNPRWLALVIALAISLVGVHQTQPHELLNYLMGVVNGCLIFCTATGVNNVFAQSSNTEDPKKGRALEDKTAEGVEATPARRVFTSLWV